MTSPPSSHPSSHPSGRQAWVDVARGIAITLVVVHHARFWMAEVLPGTQAWQVLSTALVPLRLPLFFLISGMLAGPWLTRSWDELWRRKLAGWLWAYLLWSVVATVVLGLLVLPGVGGPLDRAGTWTTLLYAPRTATWYLLALPLFLALCRLLWHASGRQGLAWLAAAAAVLCGVVAAAPLPVEFFVWDSAGRFLVCFVVGALARPALWRLGDLATRTAALAAAALILAAAAVSTVPQLLGVPVEEVARLPGLFPLTVALMGTGGLAAAVALSRTRLAPPLAACGRRTLEVYVLHVVVLHVLAVTVDRTGLTGAGDLAGLVAVPLAAALALAVSLALARPLARVPWAFAPPRWWRDLAPARRGDPALDTTPGTDKTAPGA